MDDEERATLAQRLAEVEDRLDRIGKRMTAGYGSESDRDGWLLWLRQLTAQRDDLRARLAGTADSPASPAGPLGPDGPGGPSGPGGPGGPQDAATPG